MKRLSPFCISLSLLAAAAALHAQSAPITVDKTALNISAQAGAAPVQQTINVANAAGNTVSIVFAHIAEQDTAASSWLTFSNGSCKTPIFDTTLQPPSALTITADPSCVSTGTHKATLNLYPTSLSNTPVQVAVTFVVSQIGATPGSLSFTYQSGGVVPNSQTVALSSTTVLTFNASATTDDGKNWLAVSSTGRMIGNAGSVLVSIDPNVAPTLAAGAHTGAVVVTPTNSSDNAPVTIPVTLTVTLPPPVSVSSSTVQLNYQLGGANNQSQTVTLSNGGTSDVTYSIQSSVPWLDITPASGTVPANGSVPLTVAYKASANLQPSSNQGQFTVVSSGSPGLLNVAVNLLVSNQPMLSLSVPALNFLYEYNSGSLPQPVNVIANSTAVAPSSTTGQMQVTVSQPVTTTGGSWLSVNPASASTGTATPFAVAVNPNNLTPGTYKGTITFSAPGSANGTQQLNVTLTVANDPTLLANVSPSVPLVFAQQVGQSASQLSQVITLTSSTGAPLNYTAAATTSPAGQSWLQITGNSTGTTDNNFTVAVNPTGLTAAKYTGSVTITATNPATGNPAINSPVTIPVNLYLSNNPVLLVALPGNPPGQPTLTALSGGQPAQTAFTLSSSNPAVPLNYTITQPANTSWLFVNPISGSTAVGGSQVQIVASPLGLTPGTYTANLSIAASGSGGATVDNSPYIVPVTFQVTAGTLSVTSTSLTFTQPAGGAAPPATTVQVKSDNLPLNFLATYSAPWLTVTPAAGSTSAGTLTVSVDGSKLTPGSYQDTIFVTAPNAAASPAKILVTLNVVQNTTLSVTPAGPLSFSYTVGATAPQPALVQLTSTGASTFTATAKTTDGANWLSVSPANGSISTTPTPLTISVNPSTLTAGKYTGTVTINSPSSSTPTVLTVNLEVVAIPTPTLIGIRNAASGATGAISPGENIVIFGNGIGPAQTTTLTLTSGKVSTTLAQTQVLFDGIPAPIIYASATQTSVIVPYEIAGRPTTNMTVVYSNVSSAPLTYNVVSAQPGIYTQNLTGSGPGAIVNQDFSVNGPTKPAAAGTAVAVYMTGEGNTTPQSATGGVAPLDGTGLNHPVLLPVTATVGGVPAQVVYAGSAPGFVYGAAQVNVTIPAGVPSGPQSITISVGGIQTQAGVTVQVQ